jgi:putative ABC transport system permease protein
MTRTPIKNGGFKSTLRAADVLPTSTLGLRSRRMRSVLSGLGIAIGIASIVAVLGVTRSSQSHLLAQIDRLGTNLLTVANADAGGEMEFELPVSAAPMIRQMPNVLSVAATAQLAGAYVYRNDQVPTGQTGGLSVRACDAGLLATLDASLLSGRFANPGAYPVTVLGYDAATILGINRVGPSTRASG